MNRISFPSHPRNGPYSSRYKACPQYGPPTGVLQQRLRDTEHRRAWSLVWKGHEMLQRKVRPSYLQFCFIQRTAFLSNYNKLNGHMFFLRPTWRCWTARKNGKGPGDGTWGCKYVWALTHHLRKKKSCQPMGHKTLMWSSYMKSSSL